MYNYDVTIRFTSGGSTVERVTAETAVDAIAAVAKLLKAKQKQTGIYNSPAEITIIIA